AYPIYDAHYQERVTAIGDWLESISNLQQVGRNGLHRYNNSDHSMLTAIRAVDNLHGAAHDLWAVNAESWYHETQVAEEHPYRRAAEALAGRAEAGTLAGVWGRLCVGRSGGTVCAASGTRGLP